MAHNKREALEREIRRWARPNAHLFARPDWRRFVKPGSDAAMVFEIYEQKYRPDQARVPPGSRDGGQWVDEGGGEPESNGADRGSIRVARSHSGFTQGRMRASTTARYLHLQYYRNAILLGANSFPVQPMPKGWVCAAILSLRCADENCRSCPDHAQWRCEYKNSCPSIRAGISD